MERGLNPAFEVPPGRDPSGQVWSGPPGGRGNARMSKKTLVTSLLDLLLPAGPRP